jgi:hypothetical protein
VTLLVGSQGDPAALMRWVRESGGRFDLIVDDGSHESQDQFTSLTCLWPHLNPGGFYFIEDLHYLPRDFRDRSKSYMLEVLGEWSARLTGAKSRAVYRFHHPSFSRTGEIGRRENGSATSDGWRRRRWWRRRQQQHWHRQSCLRHVVFEACRLRLMRTA